MRKLISGGGEVLSRTFIKKYLKIDFTDDDDLIDEMNKSARLWAEKYTGRQLISATWELYLDRFDDLIEVYPAPVSDVVSIKYYDTDGDLQTLSEDNYVVDTVSEPARITLAPDCTWPDTQDRTNAVVIRYVSGWTDAGSVPRPIRQAIMLTIAHLYENRQAITKDVYHKLPMGADYLLDIYKVY